MNKQGFTLAEVLITLGIIGIVAAMTIPTLVANYQAKSWSTSAAVFERKLEEALKVMNTQQTLAGYTTTEDFVNELSKHFKTTNVCRNDNLKSCFSDKVSMREASVDVDLSSVSTAADLGQNEWNTNLVGVQFANGTTALIAYNPKCSQNPYSNTATGANCIAILYDTSGFKSPNHLSKDLRINENVKKLANKNICIAESGGTCFGPIFTSESISLEECEAFRDEHGISPYNLQCHANDNFWAGAAKACGGPDKMANNADLKKLVQYLYDDPSLTNFYSFDVKLNPDKVAILGSPTADGSYYLFTNLINRLDAPIAQISPTMYNLGGTGASYAQNQAICKYD